MYHFDLRCIIFLYGGVSQGIFLSMGVFLSMVTNFCIPIFNQLICSLGCLLGLRLGDLQR